MTNKNKGFSLVELIVVFTIIGILAAVLVPTVMLFVEKARAQRDESAMGELASAIRLTLSDQEMYDELVHYMSWGNVSCYIDRPDENSVLEHKSMTKEAYNEKLEQYIFNERARYFNETKYYAAGNMRGITITFQPDNGYYVIADGIINKYLQEDGNISPVAKQGNLLVAENRACDDIEYVNAEPDYVNHGTLGTICFKDVQKSVFYNRIKMVIGEKVKITSNTYRGSDYTVFIKLGPAAGREYYNQDAVQVYGQFNGTYLLAESN